MQPLPPGSQGAHIKTACEAVGISERTYYDWKARGKKARDELPPTLGGCLARDRVSLSRVILGGVDHPSEATETPIEIQLRVLRTTLGNDLVRDLEDSVAPNTWRAYRSDLADFATAVAYTNAEWRAPEVVAAYLRTLEDSGAAYATITRRLTSIHKLVEVAAIAAGDLDYEDPTKHPRVGVTLQAIRRRLSTDQDQATPLTSQRLVQVLLSIDPATAAGIRDVAVLLVGWYGALRRSELAGLERHHLSVDRDGLILQLPQSKTSPDHSVWVPIANQPDSDWNPTTRLEDWLEAAARLRPTATEAVWLHVTRGDTVTRDAPITAAAINNMVQGFDVDRPGPGTRAQLSAPEATAPVLQLLWAAGSEEGSKGVEGETRRPVSRRGKLDQRQEVGVPV